MKRLFPLLFLLVFGLICGASAIQQKSNLADLRDFAAIEKLMPFGDAKEPCKERVYLRSIRDKLSEAPVEKRAAILNELAQKTKWGSSERFISDYVCAWYGVNYASALKYLTHAAFWWEWHIGKESERPFRFDDVSVDLLYALYEHNLDFKILHDILTTQSDAGTAELIICLTQEAIDKHPRGVLHVAELSPKGRNLAYRLLNLNPRDENHPLFILYGTESSLKKFRIYVTRVSADPKDPLCALAKGLLRKLAAKKK